MRNLKIAVFGLLCILARGCATLEPAFAQTGQSSTHQELFVPPPFGITFGTAHPGDTRLTGDGSGHLLVNGAPISGGGILDPGSNGILFRSALNTTRIATSADIFGLWSGTCTGCIALGETSVAGNPTAAVDYIRADATSHSLLCSFNGGAEVSCNSGGTLVFPLAITGGVSGGIPYASSTTALTMSALLAQNHVLLGGGTGGAPTSDALLTDASSTLTYTGSGGVTLSGATPAASGSALLLGGTIFTGGTTTTTLPFAYINLGTAGADWNTAGTMFGLNSPAGFSGNEIDLHANGSATSLFKVTSAGVGSFSSDLNFLGNLKPLSGHILLDSTAPTVTSAGTSPSIPSQNGTAAFTVNVGTGGTASAVVLAMPTAAAGWVCNASDLTNPTTGGGYYVKQTAGSATSVTLTGFSTAGSATAFTASDVLSVSCLAY